MTHSCCFFSLGLCPCELALRENGCQLLLAAVRLVHHRDRQPEKYERRGRVKL